MVSSCITRASTEKANPSEMAVRKATGLTRKKRQPSRQDRFIHGGFFILKGRWWEKGKKERCLYRAGGNALT
jgi:hypothetical protein